MFESLLAVAAGATRGYRCDLDHTIPYPAGPTCALNLGCLCRKHHLLETFGVGWLDSCPRARSSGLRPAGRPTRPTPGTRLLFPSLCKPTAPVNAPANAPTADANRGLMMPRRKPTREDHRQRRIEAERRLNDDHVAQCNKPPPF